MSLCFGTPHFTKSPRLMYGSNFIHIGVHRRPSYDVLSIFKMQPQLRNTTSGFVFADVILFRMSKSI